MNELPPGWAEAPVCQLLESSIGGVWGKEAGADEVDAVVIRVADFRDDGSINFGSAPLRSVTTRQLMSRELRVGDILLEKSGGGPTKSVGRVVRMRPASGPVVPTNFVQLLRPDDELVDSAFLFWWLWRSHSDGTASEFQRATTNIRNLRTQDYLDRRALLPPLNEQRRIVAAIEEQLSRLDAADASLAAASRRVRALVRPIREMAIKSGAEHIVGELLDGIEAGKSFKCHSRAADPNEWGVIKVSAMTWGSFNELENKAVLGNERVDPRWEIRPGDLLLSRANTTDLVGASVLVHECRRRLLLSDKSMRLLVKDGVHRPWLQLALSAPTTRAQMSAVATGTSDSMRNVSQEKVKSVRLRVPPLEDQRRIVSEVEERLSVIDAMRASIERAERRSAALRRSILERAFRGELVPQDPSDEPASVLLDRIRAERAAAAPSSDGP